MLSKHVSMSSYTVQANGEVCGCRESLVFEPGQNGHLRALEITRQESSPEQAFATIRLLVEAATGKAAPASLNSLVTGESYSQQSLGWTTRAYDTILEVSVKKDGSTWFANCTGVAST